MVYKKNYLLFAGIFFAFASSLSFVTNQLIYSKDTLSNTRNVVSSIQFWLCLIAEVIVFVVLRKKTLLRKKANLPQIYRQVSIGIYLVSLVVFGIAALTHKEATTLFETIALAASLFLFQLVFIVNSKLFNTIFAEERKM
jgi:hypothetical protein